MMHTRVVHTKGHIPSSSTEAWRISRWKLVAIIVIGLFSLLSLLYQWKGASLIINRLTSPEAAVTYSEDWKWNDIEPSRTLRWHRCYDDTYDCARLDVPMDWLDPSDDPSGRVVLAITRLRATESGSYRGSIIFNPGGPGGSGVYALRDRGALLQTIAGKDHDIISFDPRGIGASIPRVDCWGSEEKSRLWALQDVGVVNAHPGVIFDAFARATAFSQACERNTNNSPLLSHISTVSHARDLFEIMHQAGQDKLKYWGFSYGTILGGVFAAMYPDKVERLVSDGNVDYQEWHWNSYINFLHDTDKVMEAFYDFCHKAGPSSCDFYASSPAAIEERLANLLLRIREHPIIVPASGTGPDMPQLITWSNLKRLISAALYRPIFMFKDFAKVLKSLEDGDGEPFYRMVGSKDSVPVCSVETIPPNVPRLEEGNADAFPAILCADSPPMEDTVEEFAEFVEELTHISSAAGDVNALFRMACVGRTVRPKWRYAGPFEGNTSHPILYVANMADNVSPLVSARNNSRGFPGSVVLVQNSYGHTSLSAASVCTAGYIRAYFQNGTLPKPGTTCEPDYTPFDDVYPKVGDELAMASYELMNSNWGFEPGLGLRFS
ncbi:alpha/beta-hydrolase [Annulohypoxylon maeteangense]|uniref:alpha/beta-hydrolase n=1 Tax=Annulohypoxylon maeteangense TaxID=1927788 RepID=UPI0020080DE6|nr:alpha/beta-hydrolase [Annulohypoxylon maeteangense]KAI0886433.1 alpha/beta-hydrolase [Annulohypoxylon maeteangense]